VDEGTDHTATITEQGTGTVQLSVTYRAIDDAEARARAGWLMKLQAVFLDMEHVQKRSTIQVNTRDSILEHLFYTDQGREKGLAALAAIDRNSLVEALVPGNAAEQAKLLAMSDEQLGATLARMDETMLRKKLLPVRFGDKKALELEIDGNFYLEKGFGTKAVSLRTLFDDTADSASGEEGEELKVDWSAAPVSRSLIDHQHGFQLCIATFATVAAILFLVVFFSTKERVAPPKNQKTNVWQDLKSVFSNRPWVVVGIMSMFTLAQVCIYGGAIVYYFKYFVGSPGLAGPFMLVGTISNLIGVFLTDPLTRLLGSKKRVYLVLSMMTVPLNVAFFYLGPNDITIMFFLTLLGGLASGPLSPIVWAMYADIADHSEWKTGNRSTGLFFSAAMFAQKMGWTIGGAAAGWLLEYYGFEANIVQNETTIHGIRMLMSWIPAIGCFIAGILILFYSLDDKQMVLIEKELTERRAKADAEEAVTAG